MKPQPRAPGLITALVIIAALAGTLLWVSMLSAPYDLATGLRDASKHFEKAENKLSAQAMKEARYETLAGVAAARRARRGLTAGGPGFDLAEAVPVAGSALEEVDHLVRAAELTGEAAAGTLDVAQNALRGPDKIIAKDPSDEKGGSQIRIERIEEIGQIIKDVRRSIDGVRRELEAVDLKNLPRRTRPQITQAIEKAGETDRLLADAEAGFEILPGFLGADGTRNYVFGMQNSAEQRGPGGALLQYAILTINEGKPELIPTSTIYEIDRNRQTIDIDLPDDAWYVREIEDAQRFGNANWSPDWPLSAQLTLDYALASTPEFPDADGVIAVDPVLMKALMPGTGSFHTRPYNLYVTANRVVHFLLYKAYASYPIPKVRRNRLRAVVDDFYEHMLRPKHPTELVDGFGTALAGKHMQVWLKDPAEQAFIERMDWDGGIETEAEGDYLYVVEQNVGGNKLDYFTQHTNSLDVQFDGNDAAVGLDVTIDNNVFLPQPLYPMGDSGREIGSNGHHLPMMNVYVPEDAELRFAQITGAERLDTPPGAATWPAEGRPAEHLERGKRVWTATMDINPQESGSFRLGYVVPGAVVERGGRKVYRLTVQRQPKVRKETLSVRVTLPVGARDVRAQGWKRQGDELIWERPLKEDIVLEVSWRS
ncbi:MAG TPA: DUF4012 domain-containing protein [Actinomycetota bacterium]|nr:DUF4012 domain-containing protein [Actinomycetota bacterium]